MRIALVTGVAGGIGSAVAKILLEHDIAVVGLYNNTLPQIEHVNFTPCKGNLSSALDRAQFVKTAMDKYGKIDILVNVAGVAPKVRADLLEMTEESYDYVMNINRQQKGLW